MKRLICIPLIITLALTGCAEEEPESTSAAVFSMDTVMAVTAYGDGAAEAVDAATTEIYRLERLFSVTDADSDIARVNATANPVQVSDETAALLRTALDLWAETGGAFSPALYPLQRAWGFTTDDYRVPDADELTALLATADPAAVTLTGNTVTTPDGLELDLGGIAKGYTGDYLAALMAEMGIESAIFDLGGDVRTLGKSASGDPWRVALQDPSGDGYLGIIEVEDEAVITSGSYERNFTGDDGAIYHHILGPTTGAPADSGLLSVTVVAENGTLGDALATALFVMGLEEGAAFAKDIGVEAVFVTEDGTLYLTDGLKDRFTAEGDYEPVWL